MFSQNMVLQRGVPIPVWGWGPEGQAVKVRIGGQSREATVKNGKWEVTFEPFQPGPLLTMVVEPTDETLIQTFTNILVGDVWLVCGQSNVLMPLQETEGAQEAAEKVRGNTTLRILEVGHRNPHNSKGIRSLPVSFWGNLRWEDAAFLAPRSSKSDIPGGPGATGFHFITALQESRKENLPIGLIQVGAIMKAQSWVCEEEILATPEIADLAGKGYPDATSACFNANIAPLAPFPIKGVLYYQGEMNAGDTRYGSILSALIRSWRKAWNNQTLPFLIVQLPGYGSQEEGKSSPEHALDMPKEVLEQLHANSTNHGFVTVRDQQLKTRNSQAAVGLVVTIDLGDPHNIHPPRKREVGERAALLARKLAYGENDLLAEGPLPAKAEFAGPKAKVHFSNAGGGLKFFSDEALGFEAAGPDGKFVSASASIEGETLTISSPEVSDLRAVRYAWAGFPQISLFNQAGLPASPFLLEK